MFPIKIKIINDLKSLIFRTFFTLLSPYRVSLGETDMVCFVAPLMKILAFSETLGYICMALFAVELLFTIHIRLTLDTELVDGASELF